jgi:hypothetical protein
VIGDEDWDDVTESDLDSESDSEMHRLWEEEVGQLKRLMVQLVPVVFRVIGIATMTRCTGLCARVHA